MVWDESGQRKSCVVDGEDGGQAAGDKVVTTKHKAYAIEKGLLCCDFEHDAQRKCSGQLHCARYALPSSSLTADDDA